MAKLKKAKLHSEEKLRRLWKCIATDAFFEGWWAGQDDVLYENSSAREAIEGFIMALREQVK